MRIPGQGRAILSAIVAAALVLPVIGVPSASAQDACPEPPLTVAELAELSSRGGPLHERYPLVVVTMNEQALACFGSRTLTLRVFVAPPAGVGGTNSYSLEPAWLAGQELFVWDTADVWDFGGHRGDDPWITVAVPPEFGDVWNRFNHRWVRLAGRFDHPAAQSCVASGIEGKTPSPDEAIEICRSFFVLTGIEVLPSAPATDAAPEPGPTAAPGGRAAILLAGVAAWIAFLTVSSGWRDRSRHVGRRSTRPSDPGHR